MSVAVKDPKKGAHRNEDAGFPHWQSHLPNQLGVAEEWIRSARDGLEEGVDWKKQGQRVLFSQRGVTRLLELLKMAGGAAQETPERKVIALLPERAGSLLEGVAMRVVSAPKNPHLVIAVPADEDGLPIRGAGQARVKVASNVNFVPGMLLKATPVAGVAGLFRLVGACPRSKGRF